MQIERERGNTREGAEEGVLGVLMQSRQGLNTYQLCVFLCLCACVCV